MPLRIIVKIISQSTGTEQSYTCKIDKYFLHENSFFINSHNAGNMRGYEMKAKPQWS